MKITIQEDDFKKITLESDSLTVTEVLDDLRHLLLALGFHSNSVKDAFLSIAEEYELDNSCDCNNCKNKEKK